MIRAGRFMLGSGALALRIWLVHPAPIVLIGAGLF
jgi:hypothetical protein